MFARSGQQRSQASEKAPPQDANGRERKARRVSEKIHDGQLFARGKPSKPST
jgi:hypothetical protein